MPVSCLNKRLAKYGLLLLSLATSAWSAPAIKDLELNRSTDQAALVATLRLSETVEVSRVRLLLDVDGKKTGGGEYGADYMLEGPHLFSHDGQPGEWAWKRVATPRFAARGGELAIWLPLAAIPGEVHVIAEITDTDWATVSRFPREGSAARRLSDRTLVDWRKIAGEQVPPGLDLLSVAPFKMDSGDIGFRIACAGEPSASRLRLMIDTNGAERGWKPGGIDVMAEGAGLFMYPEGETQWKWEQAGTVTTLAESNLLYVVLPGVAPAGEFQWLAEMVNEQWESVSRLPAAGVRLADANKLPPAPRVLNPPLPDIAELQQYTRESLSIRFQREFLEREWLPVETAPAVSNLAPELFWTDARTGQRQRLDAEQRWSHGDVERWSGRIDDGATWELFLAPAGEGVVDVVGGVHATSDRCFRLSVGIPIPDGLWTWHDDVRFSRVMDAQQDFANIGPSPYGLTQQASLYPLGVLASTGEVLVAETDPAEPRAFVIEASGKSGHLLVHYDLAATMQTEKFPGWAVFKARFSRQPRGGEGDPFRAALSDWYTRFPEWKTARVPKHGLWMPFTDIGTVSNAEDFGFAFFEKVGPLGSDVDHAQQQGVLTLAYTEPWLYWLPLADPATWNKPAALKRMEQLARSGFGKDKDFASAGMLGAVRDPAQEIVMRFLNTPWSSGGRMEVNTDPDLPVTAGAPVNRAMAEWRYIRSVVDDPRVNGIYLDSMSAMEMMDYNTNAIAAADFPCTFIAGEERPGLAMPVQAVEFTAALGRYLESRGQYLMGNFPCWRFPFFMPFIDIPGEETTWYSGNRFTPMSQRDLNFRRAVSGDKPYGFLQATHFDTLSRADIEKYFRECLFWAFMPSFFSHDGANDPYWVQPEWYERDRVLFRTYMPLIQRMSQAGWQPLPAITAREPSFWLEQFGASTTAVFHVTARNEGASAMQTVLRADPATGPRIVYHYFTGELTELDEDREAVLQLAPGGITVLSFLDPTRLPEELRRLKQQAGRAEIHDAALENLVSFARERSRGVSALLHQTAAAVEGEPVKAVLTLHNRSGQPVTFLGWGANDGTAASAPSLLAPGERLELLLPAELQVKGGPDWQRVTWRLQAGKETLECRRVLRPATTEAIMITEPPARVTSTNDLAELSYQLRNHAAVPGVVTVEWSHAGARGNRVMELAPGEVQDCRIPVERGTNMLREVKVVVRAEERLLFESHVNVVFAGNLNHLGTQPGVRLMADSAYSGYSISALSDGVVETAGLPWNEAAFATAENPTAHWVRYLFPQPVAVASLTAYWNVEGGQVYSSQQGEVVGVDEAGNSVVLGQFTNDGAPPFTRVDFQPRPLRSIELRQPAGAGSVDRPDLLWLREVVVE